MKPVKFAITAYTDPAGKWNADAPLEGNEDNLFVDVDLSNTLSGEIVFDRTLNLSEKGCLLSVCDGMGGMNAGEVASDIAIRTIEASFEHTVLQSADTSTASKRAEYMSKVVRDADTAIKKHAKAHSECAGMGSTIIMAWLYGNELTVTWCGDSRAYLYREGLGLKQISKDHSYVQGLVDEGKITMEEAFTHPYGNIITRSLGDEAKAAEADSLTIPVYKGDIIMLNSDGLSGVLRDVEMESIIRANRSQNLSTCRMALWRAAEQADWYDNVTAIICEIKDADELPAGDAGMSPIQSSFATGSSMKKLQTRTLWLSAVIAVLVLVLAVCLYLLLAPRNPIPQENPVSPEYVVDSLQVDTVAPSVNEEVSQPKETSPFSSTPKKTISSRVAPVKTDAVQEDDSIIVIPPEMDEL